jgi:AcrR family transcriptional regulator
MITLDLPQRGGLRERKKRETRAALADAAVRLALTHGLEGLRVEDIAAAANVSMRTFNNYFTSKQEALAARYVDRMEHAATALRARPAKEPLWEAIVAAILGLWGAAPRGAVVSSREQMAELRLIFGVASLQTEVMRGALSADQPFARVVAERTHCDLRRDIYPRLVAASVTVVVQAAVNAFLHADPPVPLLPLLRDALRQLSAGLPAPDRGRYPTAKRRS